MKRTHSDGTHAIELYVPARAVALSEFALLKFGHARAIF